MRSAANIYRMLLFCYPAEFRREYGGEMAFAFLDQLAEARESGSMARQALVWLRSIADLVTVAPKEHFIMILQDIRYALRTFRSSPSYAAVVILSLALGIGANTAIFSLMNGILLSQLPVPDPGQLVILSDPRSSGTSIGSQDGERSLLTYAEFEQLRDQTSSFSGLMASQSSLDQWQIRVDGQDLEQANGRMVSREYWNVLQVSTAIGRGFEPAPAPVAVLSHPYWKRRFHSDPGVLGKSIQIRKAMVTIAGVAPPDFFGETAGQQPDIWTPLDLQPLILPGRDWLHDKGLEKVMWLHVFGRLKPGVTIDQAQANSIAVFRNGLEAYYGTGLSAEIRKEMLDQTLRLRPASSGASTARAQFNDPIRILLIVVGAVLLIACANLANLLLARGAMRRREIALRLSLGANRLRLVRQLVTESLLLAGAGAVASLAVTYALHGALTGMMSQADPDFSLAFQISPLILAYTFGSSLAATILFGLLPAIEVTKTDVSLSLKEQGRGTAGSAGGRIRWGRLLVGGQIALSLPLLLGAGLLLKTITNLQKVDLGYSKENLLLMRVQSQTAGYDQVRQLALFSSLLERIRKVPGVLSVSYSENGLFAGRNSGDSIQVEGYTPKGKGEHTQWDQIGPEYFRTLGVPLLQGRDVRESDRAGGPQVCVINEAFAKKFFENRNPIGMHITTSYGDKHVTHEIVGVAKDHRTHRLRGDTPTRNFVPLTQPLGETDSVIFQIRTTGAPGGTVNAIRHVVQSLDANLPIESIRTLNEMLDRRMAQERITAQLSAGLGIAALLLAAIGLYGVLSYGVAQRRTEIGVRIALGAHPLGVIRMILRETGTMVFAGLVVGTLLAWGAGRLLTSQLYGLSPQDPATAIGSLAVLSLVALTAAMLPAWRASKVDPMVALREE